MTIKYGRKITKTIEFTSRDRRAYPERLLGLQPPKHQEVLDYAFVVCVLGVVMVRFKII